MKYEVNRRGDVIKIRVGKDAIEDRKTRQKINEAKSSFFEKMNKINKPLARLTKNERENTQTIKNRNDNNDSTRESVGIE